MSPFSLAHILDQVVRDKASRMALEDRDRGHGDIPGSVYVERIADRLGVTKRQLYRWMEGSCSPSCAMLVRLCEICESTLPVEWLNREVGLGYYRKGRPSPDRRDLVSLVATELRESAEAGKAALDALADGELSLDGYRRLEVEIDQAQDALTALKSVARARVAESLRR